MGVVNTRLEHLVPLPFFRLFQLFNSLQSSLVLLGLCSFPRQLSPPKLYHTRHKDKALPFSSDKQVVGAHDGPRPSSRHASMRPYLGRLGRYAHTPTPRSTRKHRRHQERVELGSAWPPSGRRQGRMRGILERHASKEARECRGR